MARYDDNWLERINQYEPNHPALPWSWFKKTDLSRRVLAEWKNLISVSDVRETQITAFIRRNAGMFLYGPLRYPFALSEIRLGADHVVDLAFAEDRWSDGTRWHLVEIELPSTPPFKKNGDKSARLCHALDQIERWRSWLRRCCRAARDVLPHDFGYRDSIFQFYVVIGTVENTGPWLERRNELAQDLRVEIRSFGWLTERLRQTPGWFVDQSEWTAHDEKPFVPRVANALANPFFEAFQHAEWIDTVRNCCNCGRIMDLNADVILSRRRYSPLLKQFASYCRKMRARGYAKWLRNLHRGRHAGSLWHLAKS